MFRWWSKPALAFPDFGTVTNSFTKRQLLSSPDSYRGVAASWKNTVAMRLLFTP